MACGLGLSATWLRARSEGANQRSRVAFRDDRLAEYHGYEEACVAPQLTSAAAAVGDALRFGAGGGATGLLAGAAIGAACGVVPAVFTFGLSIPIGVAIGAGTGLVVGAVVGGTAGLVGGGASGYGAYTKRNEIRSGAEGALSKAMDCSEHMQAKATSSKEFVKQTAVASSHTVRSRLCATTGGTE